MVSFVSPIGSQTSSRVTYNLGLKTSKPCEGLELMLEASGKTEQYTQLMYWSSQLWDPEMGVATLSKEEVAKKRSMEWCQDKASGWKYPCYHNFTASDAHELHGFGRYSNPHDHYDSPNLHTVLLKNLIPNQTYCYSVENDDRVFHFKMPAPKSFPYKVGLWLG